MNHVRSLALITTLAALGAPASTAHADAPTLVTVVTAKDARKAIAIGPTGQVYEPDGKGTWVRTRAGGTAVELVGATAAGATAVGGTVIAAAKGAPPFKFKGGVWTAIFLVPKARAIVGTGSRVLAAVGVNVFDIDGAQPVKLTDAPGRVSALAAGGKTAVVATDKGLFELQGAAWKPIKKAPKAVRALVSERWALVDKGALDLTTMKLVPWPAGVRVDEVAAVGDTLYVTATSGAGKARKLELVTLTGAGGAAQAAKTAKTAKGTGALGASKLVREEIPLDDDQPIVGLVVDADRRVVVAARDGKLAVRTAAATGTWTVTEVRDELPAPRPGPAPATSAAAP